MRIFLLHVTIFATVAASISVVSLAWSIGRFVFQSVRSRFNRRRLAVDPAHALLQTYHRVCLPGHTKPAPTFINFTDPV